ncbi:MAG: hypothetical protein DRP06_02070 [Candidatus Aenigmatarchaeota archaeon]|nr:MAG: hypothetical protein DRP06_02070 [Candidatus Aenigmarchaeota archaeon]
MINHHRHNLKYLEYRINYGYAIFKNDSTSICAGKQNYKRNENIDVNLLREKISKGLVVIPANINHQNLDPIGIGSDFKVKVNANIGTSSMKSDLRTELKKTKNSS